MAGKSNWGVKDWADVVIVAPQWLTEGNISYNNNSFIINIILINDESAAEKKY